MTNLNNKNKNKNILVENLIVFFLFTVVLVFKSLKTLSWIFTYGILKKEIFKLNNFIPSIRGLNFSKRSFYELFGFVGYFLLGKI